MALPLEAIMNLTDGLALLALSRSHSAVHAEDQEQVLRRKARDRLARKPPRGLPP